MIETNVNLANIFKVQLTTAVGATRQLGNPTGTPYDCQKVIWTLTQAATPGQALTFGSKFRHGNYINTGITILSTGTSLARDYIGCMYRADTDTWDIIAFVDRYQP